MSERLARVKETRHGWRAVCKCGWTGTHFHDTERPKAERERLKHRETHKRA